MPDALEPSDFERAVAAIRREFAAGLPHRADAIARALEGLRATFTRPLAEDFHRSAHTLKGTAAEFEAFEIAGHAAALADIGRRWLEAGAVQPGEAAAAETQLELLRAAIAQWVAQVGTAS